MRKPEPEEVVRNIYLEGMSYVPYATFMRCFNKLIEDPSTGEPREPSEELYGTFEAVCMGVSAGIRDEMNRGEERKQEFYEKIYPVWRRKLSSAQAQRCQMILDGTLKEGEAAEQREKERQFKKAEEALSAAIRDAEAKARFKRDGSAAEEPQVLEVEAEQEALPAGGEAPSTGLPAAPAYPNLYAFTESIESGALNIRYGTKGDKAPFATYMMKEKEVSVRLIHAGASYYLILMYASRHQAGEPLARRLRMCMEKRGFTAKGDYAYSRQHRGHTYTVTLGKGVVSVALKCPEPFKPPSLARAVGVLHKLLQATVEEVLAGSAT